MGSPGLRELQQDFWRAIATTPGALAASEGLLAVAEPSATLDAAGRLRQYVDAYFWRLRDVLAEDFPRLAGVLGDAGFEALARDYLRAHPSAHPSLRQLGDAFPAFLGRSDEVPPFASDLARLERARTNVFDAPDDVPLTVDDLRAVEASAWPALRFTPIRAFETLRLDWPAHEIWGGDAALAPAPAPTVLRVWRGADHRVFHAAVEPRAAEALDRLVAGEPFASICGAFDDLPPEEGARLATALLARWVEDGIVAR